MSSNANAKPAGKKKNKKKKIADTELPERQLATPLVDIGINLTNNRFKKDLDDVLDRAEKASLKHLIITGTSEKASKEAILLCKRLNQSRNKLHVSCTVGCHPHDAKSFDMTKTPDLFKKLLQDKNVVAVGECGLDFNRMFSPQDVQEKVFARQIELAIETKKPLFLHERDAHESFVEILKKYQAQLTAPVVVHCFTGSLEQVKEYLEMGFYIGLTGFICDEREGRGKHLKEVAQFIPLDKLMIETDGPFIIPRNMPRRLAGPGRCEPWHIVWVLNRLAECRGVQIDSDEFTAMAQQLYDNSCKVFGLDE